MKVITQATTPSKKALFKETGIGQLPADWETARIDDKFAFTIKSRGLEFNSGHIPFVPMSLLPNGRLSFSAFEMRDWAGIASGTYFEEGDLLVSKITPCFENGKQGIALNIPGGRGFASTEVIPIKPIEGISHLPFLAMYLLHPDVRNSLAGKMEGATGRQRLAKNVLADWVMPFPPLAEQRAIAGVLSQIQAAAETQGRIIAALKELKAATMAKLFQEIPHDDSVPSIGQQEWSGKWQLRQLETLCIKARTIDPQKLPNNEFSYVDVSAVSNEDFKIISAARHSTLSAPSRARKPVMAGDVIVATVRPTLKRIALIPKQLDGQIVSTAFCVLRADRSQVLPEYLYYAVQRPSFFEQLGSNERGASYPAVTDKEVLRQQIPMPKEMNEQKRIAAILGALDQAKLAAKSKAMTLNTVFGGMLQELMTGRVRMIHNL